MATLTGIDTRMLIDGKKVEASTGATDSIVNPATGAEVAKVPSAGSDDVARVLAAAKAAQPTWAAKPVHERVAIVRRFLELVERDKDDLARVLSAESGKPITEARAEIANIPIAFNAFSERVKHLYDPAIPAGSEAGQEHNVVLTVREPLGVVVAIIPFNFPGDLFDQKVAPALLAGNAVIVKPPETNPLALIHLTHLLDEAGVTPGAINVVTGGGLEVGAPLAASPDVHLVTFTGSTEVGIATASSTAKNLTHVALELGGNDAFIVLADADVELAASEVPWGRMYNAGQVCCASKRFLVHRSVVAEFEKRVVALLGAIRVGDPADEATQMGPLITEHAAREVEKQINLTLDQGGRLLLGGKREGAYVTPTVITDIPRTADVARDLEIFGPVVSIIPFDMTDEAVDIANASIFGLSNAVFSRDFQTAYQVSQRLESGGVVINGASFFRSFEQPFGGYKHSGIGREGVFSTFDEVTQRKSIILKGVAK